MKTRRHKTPRQKLIKDCDTLFSKIIRKRDPVCVYCGKNKTRHTHHLFSRRFLNTRWDFSNGWSLCGGCHLFLAHVDPIDFHDFAKKKIGEKEYNRLRAISHMVSKVDLGLIKLGLQKYWEVEDARR